LKKILKFREDETVNTKRKIWVAPSILSADFSRLAEEIREVEKAGCDSIHVDVMDGHFVPNLTIGPPVIQWIRKVTKLPLDVHLMIEEPSQSIEDYRKAGADWLTIHVESTDKVAEALDQIKKLGAKVGLSLRPKTPLAALKPFLEKLDLVLIMTVEPGFGGQAFMPDMMPKVEALRPQFSGLISVDGGINAQTARAAIQAGADILVAGSAIFGHKNRAQAIQSLRDSSQS
jgi:ribulose-phosphate 3-epimerase